MKEILYAIILTMSCFNPSGQPPQPPRVWSRVQNRCSTQVVSDPNPNVFFPITNQILPIQVAAEKYRMIEKGNVLQYKKNSSNLTKQQRYARIVSGTWNIRNKTLATQGQNFTDPNTRKFARVNYQTIFADNGANAGLLPVTCPEPVVIPIPEKLPPNLGTPSPPPTPTPQPVNPNVGPNTELDPNYPSLCPQYVDPADYVQPPPVIEISNQLPPRAINQWPAMILPEIRPSLPTPARDVIANGGNFICAPDNICPTPESSQRQFFKSNNCNPTTDSDVPGPIQQLCYNQRKHATFYPRQRRVMSNSGDKFPTGYKFNN